MSVLSNPGQIDFPSRISARAVLVGATIAIVSFSTLLALGGGLGLLPAGPMVDANAVREAGPGLAVWGVFSLLVAAFGGAFLSAVISKATSPGDGLLHGAATWAVGCAAATVLSCVWLMSAISLDLVSRDITIAFSTRGAFWTYFVADVFALGSALLGGNLGVRWATRISGRMRMTREEPEPVAQRPAPLPT
jgi:hypothetical protein